MTGVSEAGVSTGVSASGVTAAAGFRAAGVTAGLKASGDADVALVVNDGPRRRRGRGVHLQPRARPTRCCGASARSPTAGCAPSCSTPAARTAAPGRTGFADHARHRRAGRRPCSGSPRGDVLVCSTGLIGERLPMDGCCSPASRPPRRRCRTDGGAAAADAIMTTDTVPKTTPRRRRGGWTVGGMAKGAGMLAPALATMLVVLTTDAVVDAADLRRGAARRHPASPSTGSTPTAACRPTTPCCCWPAARPGSRPTAAGVRRGRPRRPARDLARQLLADAEGAEHDIAIEVRRRRRPRTTPSRSAGRWPAATCSRPRSSARTPTGAGSSPRSARRRRPSTRPTLDVAINGVQVCRDGGPGEDPGRWSTCPGARCDVRDRPARRRRPPPRSGPTTSPTTTSTRTARTRHDRPRCRHDHAPDRTRGSTAAAEGRRARRGAALAAALPRRDRRGQVRRQRDDRRRAASAPSPRTSCSCARPGCSRSSCTAAARRSRRCSSGSGIASEFRGGLRVTTPEAMDVVRMVLVGQVGRELVGLVNAARPARRSACPARTPGCSAPSAAAPSSTARRSTSAWSATSSRSTRRRCST